MDNMLHVLTPSGIDKIKHGQNHKKDNINRP